MNTMSRFFVALTAAVLSSSCAGADFKRPGPGALTVGKSTTAEVTRVMGKPHQVGESIKNEQKLKTLHYTYADAAGTGRYPGVVPARVVVFSAFNDLLVGQEFISSFAEDATDFDESKVSALVKGKTTRTQVLQLLGRPTGEAIYPVVKKQGDKTLLYSYSHAKGDAFNMKFYNKALIVSFGPGDVVSDVEFSSNGEK
ncbi:outer membrane protein assembly factor BamE [Aquabacterium sp. A7-Y]|uniref:hypothetical protein n=1 Tax=Aquabacterium sp. A7-Y TaxID=1349605 RepID=UPI00223DA5D0|nr:hypothetical protein [Aquabacterium sp. A7-Y]MCW7536553.1 outer membrane protein assembly factor BamE [Aquabacterium sp. A7-Y]